MRSISGLLVYPQRSVFQLVEFVANNIDLALDTNIYKIYTFELYPWNHRKISHKGRLGSKRGRWSLFWYGPQIWQYEQNERQVHLDFKLVDFVS